MAINRALKLMVETTFDVVPDRSHGDELTFICPEPGCGDKTGNRSVNLHTGQTNCWKCSKGGLIFKWAERIGITLDTEGFNIPDTSLRDLDAVIEDTPPPRAMFFNEGIKLPQGFVSLKKRPEGAYARMIEEMAIRKNLTLKDLIRAGCGYTKKGRWEPYAIFPVTEWNQLVYYQGRTYDDVPGESTKKFPSRKEVPYGSRHWVYNIDKARATPGSKIIIVEAILSVLSLTRELRRRKYTDVVPVAIFKHSVSREQAEKIRLLKASEVCLMFDNDAILSSFKTVARVPGMFNRRVSIVKMPKDSKGKGIDPNDDAKLAVDLWEKRQSAGSLAGIGMELDSLIESIQAR